VVHRVYLASWFIAYIGRDYAMSGDRALTALEICVTPLPVLFCMIFIRPIAMIR
jgi:hypothetical protein